MIGTLFFGYYIFAYLEVDLSFYLSRSVLLQLVIVSGRLHSDNHILRDVAAIWQINKGN
jgi:hypothetical protein